MNTKDVLRFLTRLRDQIPADMVSEHFLLESLIESHERENKNNQALLIASVSFIVALILGIALGRMQSPCP